MTSIKAIDKLEIWTLIDNSSDDLSSAPDNVLNEFTRLEHEGKIIGGKNLCCAHHGLSLLLVAYTGHKKHILLFDTGPEWEVLERNCNKLQVPLAEIEAIVLSHGHWDHGGALLEIMQKIAELRQQKPFYCYVNPDMFYSRALRANGKIYPMEDVPSPQSLSGSGVTLINSPESKLLLESNFYLSGEIPRLTAYEPGLLNHMKKIPGNGWQPDPLILDERFVAVYVRNKGLIVFTACSHAGLINVLKNAHELFPNVPLYAVVGGFHLSGAGMENRIPNTIKDIKQFNLKYVIPGHCTGWRAIAALENACDGAEIVPLSVGKKFFF